MKHGLLEQSEMRTVSGMMTKAPIIAAVVFFMGFQGLSADTPASTATDAPPKTVKEAVLRAIDLSAGQHVFDREGHKVGKERRTVYRLVQIEVPGNANGPIQVAFRFVYPEGTENPAPLLFEFSSEGARTTSSPSTPASPRRLSEDDRRIERAVKMVLARELSDESSSVSIQVGVMTEKQSVDVIVIGSLRIGDHRMYVVNERNEIERVIPGL